MTTPGQAPGRRSLALAVLAVGAVAAAALVVSALSPRPPRGTQSFTGDAGPQVAPPPPPALMAGLMPGTRAGPLRVVGARLLEQGVFRVELEGEGDPHVSVDIARLDPALPPPQVHTATLGLYLANDPGTVPLSESRLKAFEALVAVLAEAAAKGAPVPPGLKTIAEVRALKPGDLDAGVGGATGG